MTGIGFALSATDLIEVLHKFYPNSVPVVEKLSTPLRASESGRITAPKVGEGKLTITQPEGAEIWVDSSHVGDIPSQFKLPAGTHLVVIKSKGHADWMTFIKILDGSDVTLKPDLEPAK